MHITPKGKQEEVMALPVKGHTIVLGTAGSGKTTIALLRAYHLANLPGDNKVLLVTFNGALVSYMRGMNDSTSKNLVVENYHKFARGYLNSRDKMPCWNGILNSDEKAHYIEKALSYLRIQFPAETTFKRSTEFFVDEITFIEKFGFDNLISYVNAERIGRSTANIKRENRKWIFDTYEKYLQLREEDGRKYDWDDLAYYTNKELLIDKTSRRYTHIIIDEGQDFSPIMIKSLVNAVGEDGSFSFFGDVAQQIYGSRLSWRDSGINADKIWKFDVNYRNPATITTFAKDITQNIYWRKDVDMVEASDQIAKGPKPILVKFSNYENELNWIIDRAIATGKTSSTVIICRNRSDIDLFLQKFGKRGIKTIEIDKDTAGYAHVKTIYLSTFHAAKGLEFENVFVPFLSENHFPDPEAIRRATTEQEAFADEIKLLYVAATRSKYGLYMSYSGSLSPLFPKESSSCDYYDEGNIV